MPRRCNPECVATVESDRYAPNRSHTRAGTRRWHTRLEGPRGLLRTKRAKKKMCLYVCVCGGGGRKRDRLTFSFSAHVPKMTFSFSVGFSVDMLDTGPSGLDRATGGGTGGWASLPPSPLSSHCLWARGRASCAVAPTDAPTRRLALITPHWLASEGRPPPPLPNPRRRGPARTPWVGGTVAPFDHPLTSDPS